MEEASQPNTDQYHSNQNAGPAQPRIFVVTVNGPKERIFEENTTGSPFAWGSTLASRKSDPMAASEITINGKASAVNITQIGSIDIPFKIERSTINGQVQKLGHSMKSLR